MYKYICVAVLLLLSNVQSQDNSDSSSFIPGSYIIKFTESASADKMNRLAGLASAVQKFESIARGKASKVSPGNEMSRYYTLAVNDTAMTVSQIQEIFGQQNVEHVEQNATLEFYDLPADSLFPHQWYLHNTGQEYYGIERIEGYHNDTLALKSGVPGMDAGLINYYLTPPAEKTKIIVGIIDSGVDVTHPQLQGQFWINEDEIPDNGIDDDHNGYIDDTLGMDISGDILGYFEQLEDNSITDEVGHGTHIAGIVAARGDSSGVAGVAPNALIMPVKLHPNFNTSVAVRSILYAVDNGADILNLSWGTWIDSPALKDAINYARQNEVLVCVAAGNSGGADIFYPAAYESSFTVGATNSDGFLTSFTTYGSHIDIVAPGRDILSLCADGTDMYNRTYVTEQPLLRVIDSLYYLSDGTSMAAPVVAAAAAILWSVKPELTLTQVENYLRAGAVDMVDPFNRGDNLVGYDSLSGHGRINIDNTIMQVLDPGLHIISPVNKQRYIHDVPVKIYPSGGYNEAWKLYYTVNNNDWILLAEGNSIPNDSILYLIDGSFPDGDIGLKIVDQYGESRVVHFYYPRNASAMISSPAFSDTLAYRVSIAGYAYGPEYDSLQVIVDHQNITNTVMTTSKEFYGDELIYWLIPSSGTGVFTVYLHTYHNSSTIIDSVSFFAVNTFADGWPQVIDVDSFIHFPVSPVAADLNRDGSKELYLGTSSGLYGFTAFGEPLPGFPLLPNTSLKSVPAVYDVNRDGFDDLVLTGEQGIYVVQHDGSLLEGWPKGSCESANFVFGYHPATIGVAGPERDSVIMTGLNNNILAYKFDGTTFGGVPQFADYFPGSSSLSSITKISNMVTSFDLNNDNSIELIGSIDPGGDNQGGIGLFDDSSGNPLLDPLDPLIISMYETYGFAVTDLNNDSNFEIVTCGEDFNENVKIWVKTNFNEDYPGWPVTLEGDRIHLWMFNSIGVADLDLDGSPEILASGIGYGMGKLFIFRADGTPYRQALNEETGVAYTVNGTIGIPIVANLMGDDFPEVIFRSGHIFPGVGSEQVHILDHNIAPVKGYPIETPTSINKVSSSQFAPLVDDLDSDGLVELVLLSDDDAILVWDFDASINDGKNVARFLGDNLNTNIYRFQGITTDINDNSINLPNTVELLQNYPNPFNPRTSISFVLPAKSRVSLNLFNILGQQVVTLAEGIYTAGEHTIPFDAADLASGIYLYQLVTERNSISKKMVLLK